MNNVTTTSVIIITVCVQVRYSQDDALTDKPVGPGGPEEPGGPFGP